MVFNSVSHRTRRTHASRLATVVSIALATLVLCAGAIAAPETKPEAVAYIHYVSGTIEVLSFSDPEKGWQRTWSGQDLYPGDKLRTGSKDKAAVKFDDKTIDVFPDSILYMPETQVEKSTGDEIYGVLIDVKDGLVRWWSGESDEKSAPIFQMRSPTGVAGTRDGFVKSDKGGAHMQRVVDNVSGAPKVISMEEHNSKGSFTGTWTWDGEVYQAKWSNGATAILNLEKYDRNSIVITRHDTAGPSKGLNARYEARVGPTEPSDDGTVRSIVDGTASWTFANGRNITGTWSGRLSLKGTQRSTGEGIYDVLDEFKKGIEDWWTGPETFTIRGSGVPG